jgi:hypothetical protein
MTNLLFGLGVIIAGVALATDVRVGIAALVVLAVANAAVMARRIRR